MIEFNAKVVSGGRIQVPQWLRDGANINDGDVIKIAFVAKVHLEKGGSEE